MDIYPQSAAASNAIARMNNRDPLAVCAIDATHRCCTTQCKYFVVKNVAVCKASRHTHVCADGCPFSAEQIDGTFCTLTGRQTGAVAVKQYLNKATMVYGKRVSNQHWTEVKKKKKKCNGRRNTTSAAKVRSKCGWHVRQTLQTLFTSQERAAMTTKATERQIVVEKSITASRNPTFALYQEVYECRMKNNHLLNPPPDSIPEPLTKYLIDMIAFIEKQASSKHTSLKRTGHSVVLGLIELLQSGFVVDGCVLVRPSPFLQRHAPDVTQVGKLPNIRARQQTIATRLVKLALVSEDGEPLRQLPQCPL